MSLQMIRWFMTDGPTDISASTSLTVAAISGAITVIVAVIGLVGTRDRRKSTREQDTVQQQERTSTETEKLLVEDLRRRNEGLMDTVRRRDREIDRLEALCWENGINPHTEMRRRHDGK